MTEKSIVKKTPAELARDAELERRAAIKKAQEKAAQMVHRPLVYSE